MSWFVKRVVLEKANTGAKLLKINLNYQQNILPFNKIHIGFGAQKIMMKFAKMQFSYLKSKYLRKSVLFFLLFWLVNYLKEAHWVVQVSPVIMKEKPNHFCNCFKNLLLQLNELQKLSTKECDKTIQEHKKFMLEVILFQNNWVRTLQKNWKCDKIDFMP